MPTYDDSRYTYNQANLTYDGTLLYPARTGAQSSGTGSLTVHRIAPTLTGSQPASTGSLTALRIYPTLTSTQPAASGSLTAHRQRIYAPRTGTQLPASGVLSYEVLRYRALSGSQPSASSVLTREVLYHVLVLGAQSSASGVLAARSIVFVFLTGAQPAGTGTLVPHYIHRVTLTGAQPSGSGGLQRERLYRRSLTGQQSSGQSGNLTDTTVSYVRQLDGQQPPATGELDARHFHIYHVLLEGFQPITVQITYDEPGILYDAPGVTYDGVQDPAHLTWKMRFARLLEGLQEPSSGEIVWKWNPYVWARYSLSITDRPEVIGYQFDLDADDHTITYDVDEAELQNPVVYRVSGVRVYTQPPPGVRDLP